MQDVELHMDPAIAERNPSGIALMHQLTEPIHRPHLIGIDGRSGAGKTSLAGQLAQAQVHAQVRLQRGLVEVGGGHRRAGGA